MDCRERKGTSTTKKNYLKIQNKKKKIVFTFNCARSSMKKSNDSFHFDIPTTESEE